LRFKDVSESFLPEAVEMALMVFAEDMKGLFILEVYKIPKFDGFMVALNREISILY